MTEVAARWGERRKKALFLSFVGSNQHGLWHSLRSEAHESDVDLAAVFVGSISCSVAIFLATGCHMIYIYSNDWPVSHILQREGFPRPGMRNTPHNITRPSICRGTSSITSSTATTVRDRLRSRITVEARMGPVGARS